MKSIIAKELKLMLKTKGNFFFLFIMPMGFIFLFASVFGNMGNSTITIHYTNNDHSKAAQSLLNQLEKVDGFQIKKEKGSVDSGIQKIHNGKITSLLVIPKGFSKQMQSGNDQANIKFYKDSASSQVTAPISAILNNMANGYQKQKLAGKLAALGQTHSEIQQTLLPPIKIKDINETGNNSNQISMVQQVVPGYTVMFVFFIILTIVRGFHGEKESGMLSRLRSTPMKAWHYLVGMWIPSLIAVLVQCTVLLSFGHFVYDMKLGDLSAVSATVLCLAIAGTGIGVGLALLIRGENQGRGITMLITMGGAALGGVWVPAQFMPHFAQIMGHFTPQYWAQKGLKDILIRGAHINNIWSSLAALLAFGTAGFIVALLRFKHFLRSATN